ncbi:MAG: cysteine desulfurase [Fimbriiglobus sp.]|jgi:cysteine desulfurase|nr:cysteine desulfurase [Fimbriiglobus sp.]
MPHVYLDHAASTPLLPAARDAIHLALAAAGNPSSAHSAGRHARRLLEDARDRVAALLGATPAEVVFTSGATEANNLAIFGLAHASRQRESPGHVENLATRLASSPIEHPCVVEPLRQLAAAGLPVTWLPVRSHGVVETKAVLDLITADTRLVTLMLANHETGAVQPVREVAHALRGQIHVHTDAAQAVGKIPVNFRGLGVATLTASAHKFGGPAGVGLLLVRDGVQLRPQMFGGHQQRGHRPGTEPVALAVGLAAALEHSTANLAANIDAVTALRATFVGRLGLTEHVVNSPPDALPHILNVSFPGCRSELLLMALDLAGVACSTGSACSSGSLLPSPVLEAMGVPPIVLDSAMRFSFSPSQTIAEVEWAADRVVECVRRLRG